MYYHVHKHILSQSMFVCFSLTLFDSPLYILQNLFITPPSFTLLSLSLWPYITFFVWIIHPLNFVFNPCRLAQTFKCFIHNFCTTQNEFLIEQYALYAFFYFCYFGFFGAAQWNRGGNILKQYLFMYFFMLRYWFICMLSRINCTVSCLLGIQGIKQRKEGNWINYKT